MGSLVAVWDSLRGLLHLPWIPSPTVGVLTTRVLESSDKAKTLKLWSPYMILNIKNTGCFFSSRWSCRLADNQRNHLPAHKSIYFCKWKLYSYPSIFSMDKSKQLGRYKVQFLFCKIGQKSWHKDAKFMNSSIWITFLFCVKIHSALILPRRPLQTDFTISCWISSFVSMTEKWRSKIFKVDLQPFDNRRGVIPTAILRSTGVVLKDRQ